MLSSGRGHADDDDDTWQIIQNSYVNCSLCVILMYKLYYCKFLSKFL